MKISNYKVYSYDRVTKEFNGIEYAQESPLEPGKYLLPAHTTEVPAPEAPPGKLVVWDSSKWVFKNIPKPVEIAMPEPKSITWDDIRKERNYYLKESDWVVLPDATPTNKEAWLKYRQKLRDITKLFNNPNEVIWPKQPL